MIMSKVKTGAINFFQNDAFAIRLSIAPPLIDFYPVEIFLFSCQK